MTDTIRSPQADILDQLVWSRLSQFWTKDYDPSDKEALNAVYEGCLQVLDAEYTRLFEINSGKSILTSPVHSQRRWLRLDLNRHRDLAAFLKFLQSDAATGTGSINGNSNEGDTLECAQSSNHARHWHIQFPYVVPAGDAISRSTLDLTFPTELSLVTIHRLAYDAAVGKVVGTRLKPGIDYTVLPNKTSIRITNTIPTEKYEFNVGFDFSGETYNGLRPLVAYAPGTERVSSNVVLVPPSLTGANLAIHALVVRNTVDTGAGGLLETNNASFTTEYEFYPYTGTSTGPRHGAVAGQVALPPDINLSPSDAVFVFGLERGEWNLAHRHNLASTFLNPGAIPGRSGNRVAGTTSEISFTSLVEPGVFGSLGYLGQNFEVYLNGKILARTEYAFRSDNKLHLATPISWTSDQFVEVAVRHSAEYEVIQQVLGDQHVHYACLVAVANPPQAFGVFDDGGDFDDEGIIDDSLPINVLYVGDILASLPTLEVFADGDYLARDIDYVAVKDPESGRIRLSFAFNIQGKSILATYRREVRTFIYGDFATSSFGLGITGGNRSTLSGLLTDVQGLIDSFGQSYQYDAANVGRLVEAAQVAAVGGNPLLTLFFDEFEEYVDLPIDAPDQPYSAFDARNLESANTQLVSIPFLVDHVLNPTIRLREGQDYDIVEGKLLSSVDLTAKRGVTDSAPGVWWCPVTFLDEQYLARNFGSLVGDVQESSRNYQNQLNANFNLRFHGPVVKTLEWDLAIMLGSKSFTQDAKVLSTNEELIGYNVTVGDASTQQIEFVPATFRPLTVGTSVVPTQSLTFPPLFSGKLVNLRSFTGSQLVIDEAVRGIKAGDVVRMTVVNPTDPLQTELTFSTKVKSASISLDFIIPRTTIILERTPRYAPTTNSTLLILRQSGAPYASVAGEVLSVEEVYRHVIRTSAEVFKLDPGVLPEQRPGQDVVRGEPLFPSYALVYDHIRRPNWHYLSADQFRLSWEYAAKGLGSDVEYASPTKSRTATVFAPADAGSYSEMQLTPSYPLLARGTVITLTDSVTQEGTEFRVVGNNGSRALVTPTVSQTKTGFAEIENVISAKADLYFESQSPSQGAAPETSLSFPQLVRSRSLQVTSSDAFPTAGRVMVLLPNGGSTEFAYTAKSSGFFLQCEWPDEFPALTGKRPSPTVPGALDPIIPTGSTLRLVSTFTTQRINPAFVALVNVRAKQSTGPVTVTTLNADQLYDMLKTTSSVFESRVTNRPAAVTAAIDDLTPTSSTLVAISKHALADFYYPRAEDRVSYASVMSLTVTPAPDVTETINLPSGTTSVLLTVSVLDPDAASPYTYEWTQAPFVNVGVSFSTPAATSTTLSTLTNGSVYYVRIKVKNANDNEAVRSFRIVVAS